MPSHKLVGKRRAIASLLFILTALMTRAGVGAARQEPPLPQDVIALRDAARAAISGRQWDALRARGKDAASLAWIADRRKPADDRWTFHVIALPGPQAGGEQSRFLGIFSTYHSCQSIGDHFHHLVRTGDAWKIGDEIPERETLGFRVRDHHLNVSFNLAGRSMSCTDEVTVERRGAKNGDVCLLRLSANLQVDDVRRGGEPVAFAHAPGVIALRLPDAGKAVYAISYHGAFDQPGMDSYVNEREVFLNSYWYPHIARLPARSGVTVTVPRGWTAVGQGELISRSEKGDKVELSFHNEVPVSYFSLDAGPYRVTERDSKPWSTAVYQLQDNPREAQRAMNELAKSLAYFEKVFGKYPYTRYGLVQTLGTFGGALEAYSFSTYAGRGFGGVTHEVAHTWWGGIVPNTYTKSQWNESFASYCEGLFVRQTATNPPSRALRGMHSGTSYGREMIQAFRVPVAQAFDTENDAHNNAGYGKGALVLAMLEDEIGTEPMLASMRRFIADHASGEAAEWPDFERAVAKTVGKDMRWFFEQWIERAGVPVVSLASAQKRRNGSTWIVTGEIAQSGKPYRLTLPVTLRNARGASSTHRVTIDAAANRFTLTSENEPVSVILDPDGNVLFAGGKTAGQRESPLRVDWR